VRILLSGMLAGDPNQGGATWAVLQYLLGLRELGHDVVLVEPVDDPAAVRLYFEDVVHRFGLDGRTALVARDASAALGVPYDDLRRLAERSDVLINVSGMLTDPQLRDPPPVRLWLDLDPAFNQLWHAAEGIDMRFDAHTAFATVGQRIGHPDCDIPTCGRDWIHTLPPVVLAHWPTADQIVHDAFTTVGNWRGYGSIEHRGVLHGQKAHSLRALWPLPTRTEQSLLLALAIHPDEKPDLAQLDEHGWQLVDPAAVAGTPNAYAAFVRGSKAEFGLAKSGYVASRCGWFSDRSACYLASGRPVLAQDTGFAAGLPAGDGLLAFSSVDDALAGIEEIAGDYRRHARGARRIAEERLASDRVLPALLAAAGAPA
jgi:hypothetical protein